MVQGYIGTALALALLTPAAMAGGAATTSQAVVEGHTAFAVLDVPGVWQPDPVQGLATCHVTLGGHAFGGLPAALSMGACDEKLRAILATPDVFGAPREDALTPTGRARSVEDAVGRVWTTREYTFPLPDGSDGVTFGTSLGPTLVDEAGQRYNYVLALPGDAVREGQWHNFTLTPGRLG